MDEPPLSEQIAQTQAYDHATAAEAAKAQAIILIKQKKLAILRVEQEKGMRNAAHFCGLYEQNKEADRELARFEGKEYRDPDKPDGDWPDAPEPPEPS